MRSRDLLGLIGQKDAPQKRFRELSNLETHSYLSSMKPACNLRKETKALLMLFIQKRLFRGVSRTTTTSHDFSEHLSIRTHPRQFSKSYINGKRPGELIGRSLNASAKCRKSFSTGWRLRRTINSCIRAPVLLLYVCIEQFEPLSHDFTAAAPRCSTSCRCT